MKQLLICALAALFLASCRPTESGYRRAYEKAIYSHGANEPGYNAIGEDLTMQKIVVGKDTADCASAFVAVTPGIGNPPAKLRQFCAVAGSFRQKFTAADLCRRLMAAGYDSAFVVQTGKPRYYVVAKDYPDARQAVDMLLKLKQDSIIAGKGFILRPADR